MSATSGVEQTAKFLSKSSMKKQSVVSAFGGKIVSQQQQAVEDEPAYLSLPFKKRALSLTGVLGFPSRGGFM